MQRLSCHIVTAELSKHGDLSPSEHHGAVYAYAPRIGELLDLHHIVHRHGGHRSNRRDNGTALCTGRVVAVFLKAEATKRNLTLISEYTFSSTENALTHHAAKIVPKFTVFFGVE